MRKKNTDNQSSALANKVTKGKHSDEISEIDGAENLSSAAPEISDEAIKEIEKEEKKITASENEIIYQLEQLFRRLYTKMEQLENHFNTSLKYDAHKDQIIDRLHGELQEHKDDLIAKVKRSLINDLISFYDDFGKILSHYKTNTSDLSPEECIKILKDFQQYVLDILEKHDVFLFQSELPQFDPKTQQAMRVVTTNNPEQARQIKEQLRVGFKKHEQVIRPEGVAVYRYQPLEKSADHKNGDSATQEQNQLNTNKKEE